MDSNTEDDDNDQSNIDATKIDIEDMDQIESDEIEVIDEEEGSGLVSAETEHEWHREVVIVRLTGSCVNCDGEVEETTKTSPDGDTIVHISCMDCNSMWYSKEDEDYSVSNQ